MRVPAALLLLALLAPLAFVPATAQSWHIDGVLFVQSTSKAELQYRIEGLRNTVLTLYTPDGGTLVGAQDTTGQSIDATPVGADQVRVSIGSRGAIVRFEIASDEGPPFVVFPVQLNGQGSSSLSLVLPTGWRLAAAADRTAGGDPTQPDAQGRFQREGGGYFYYVVTPPEVADAGPDLRVRGPLVLREVNAPVPATSIHGAIDHVYDTGYYSARWSILVPDDATAISVRTPYGAVPFSRNPENVSFEVPYPNAFDLGGRPFTVAYDLPAPVARGGPFREVNVSAPAGSDDTVTVRLVLPEGATYTGAVQGDAAEVAPLTWRSVGAAFVSARYLPPVEPGHARFTEGLFVVDAPSALEAKARITARNASDLLPKVSTFLEPSTRPFFVAYTNEPVFDWEEGFYSNGVNTISIRASDLDNVTTTPDVGAVNTLIHEATHGLYDRQLRDVGENNSFIREGLSRLAEIHVESYFPDQVPDCDAEGTTCHPGVRITSAKLQAFHKDARTFPPDWDANNTAAEDRAFFYGYSGTIMRAFEERAPAGALPAALVNLSRTPLAASDAAEAERIVTTLLAYAPGTTRAALLYPGRELVSLDAEHFRYCMGDLVAPPYPWERDQLVKNKPCPANGYGGSQATLPAPPPEAEPTPVPPPPTVVASAPPVLQPPTSLPTPTSGGETTGEVPAGRVDPGSEDPELPPVEVPGPALGLVLALVLALALVTRRA